MEANHSVNAFLFFVLVYYYCFTLFSMSSGVFRATSVDSSKNYRVNVCRYFYMEFSALTCVLSFKLSSMKGIKEKDSSTLVVNFIVSVINIR